MTFLSDLLPDLGTDDAWVLGLALVLTVLRPVGRRGWLAAGTVIAAAGVILIADATGRVAILSTLAWVVLGVQLVAAATQRPLRWEPRTGPSAASALTVGAAVFHLGAAVAPPWAPSPLGDAAHAWAGGGLDSGQLIPATAGPLSWPLAWLLGSPPFVDRAVGVALLGLLAVAAIVLGAERLGHRWGHVGTARCVAAAVAWAPPLLLAHGIAVAALVSTAALVWSLWALLEIWAGRHRSGRLSAAAGALLGVAIGVSLWPAIVLPVWVRRLGGRSAAWFAVGLSAALAAAAGALAVTDVSVADVWRIAVVRAADTGALSVAGGARAWVVVAAVITVALALAAAVASQPLSPTRLIAVTGALLLAVVPWWPYAALVAGPVAATPFLLLTAIAPDRPDERWPPDAALASDHPQRVRV